MIVMVQWPKLWEKDPCLNEQKGSVSDELINLSWWMWYRGVFTQRDNPQWEAAELQTSLELYYLLCAPAGLNYCGLSSEASFVGITEPPLSFSSPAPTSTVFSLMKKRERQSERLSAMDPGVQSKHRVGRSGVEEEWNQLCSYSALFPSGSAQHNEQSVNELNTADVGCVSPEAFDFLF